MGKAYDKMKGALERRRKTAPKSNRRGQYTEPGSLNRKKGFSKKK